MANIDGPNLHLEWISQPGPRAAVVLGTITGDSRSWPTLYAPLAAQVPVLCMDVRNQGQSSFTSKSASLSEQVHDLACLLDASGVSEPIWVGNSASTLLACRAAAELPAGGLVLLAPLFSFEMTRKVRLLRKALLGATADPSLTTFHSLLTLLTYGSKYLEAQPMVIPVGLARLRALFTSTTLRLACEQTFFPELEDPLTLKSISCPVLVVQPEQDEFMAGEVARAIAQSFHAGEYETLPCGHGLLEEEPDLLFRSMATFIERCTRNCPEVASNVE